MHCPVCKCYCHNEELDDCPTCGTAYELDNTDLEVYETKYVDLGEITEKANFEADDHNRLTSAIMRIHPGHGQLGMALVDASWIAQALREADEIGVLNKLDPFLINLDKLINLEG